MRVNYEQGVVLMTTRCPGIAGSALSPCKTTANLFFCSMQSVPTNAAPTSDHAARERIRHRRRANQFTVIACLFAASAAVALGLWLPTLAE
jgi:hypothetical protein